MAFGSSSYGSVAYGGFRGDSIGPYDITLSDAQEFITTLSDAQEYTMVIT